MKKVSIFFSMMLMDCATVNPVETKSSQGTITKLLTCPGMVPVRR